MKKLRFYILFLFFVSFVCGSFGSSVTLNVNELGHVVPTDRGLIFFSGETNNSTAGYNGNGAGLTNLPLATYSSGGAIDTNDYLFSQIPADWQKYMEPLPFRAQVVGTELLATNIIEWHKNIPPNGYNVMYTFEHMFARYRVGGHLVINATNFPSGIEGYRQILHTNGWRWGMWYDSANATAEGSVTLAQFIDDITTIRDNFHPDIFWVDEADYKASLAAEILSTAVPPIQLIVGVRMTSGATPPQRTLGLGQSFRTHVSSDPNTWADFMEYCYSISTNMWQFAGPGRQFFIGPEAVTTPALVMASMWGGHIMTPFCNNASFSYGNYTVATNRHILAIQSDPAGIVARLALVTNGCWVWLKPLGTPRGPSFAVAIVNTNGHSTNISITPWRLNKGLQQSSMVLIDTNYAVVNLFNNAFSNNVIAATISSQDATIFELTPLNSRSKSYPLHPKLSVQGGTAWTSITHDAYAGPINPGGNTYLRDGYSTKVDNIKHIIYSVPDNVNHLTITETWDADATISWTNVYTTLRSDPVLGVTSDASVEIAINATNGTQSVTCGLFFQPNTIGQRHWIGVTMFTSTNTTATVYLNETATAYLP